MPEYKLLSSRTKWVAFVAILLASGPYYLNFMIHHMPETQKVIHLVFYIIGNLYFLYCVAELVGMYSTTISIQQNSQLWVTYKSNIGFMNWYTRSAKYLVPLYYMLYVIVLHFQLYYLLFAVALLISNSNGYTLGNKIYFQNGHVFKWNSIGAGYTFHFVKHFSVKEENIHVLFDNSEHLIIECQNTDPDRILEYLKTSGAIQVNDIMEALKR